MTRALAHVAILVRDYDEAIAWYTQALGFVLLEDSAMEPGKRFVRVGPPGGEGATLLLARAANPVQEARIGDQSGGRVFLFLHTDDFDSDHARLERCGARFTGPPRHESYGTVAVFVDLYGNKWDLIEPRA